MTDKIVLSEDKFGGDLRYIYYKEFAQAAYDQNHPYWVDGVPVTAELEKFVQELRAQSRLRDMKLYADTYGSREIFCGTNNAFRVWEKLSIAYPDAPKRRVGWIAFDNDSYIVQSDKIQNERFKSHSAGYTQKKSKDMTKMVKVARQYLMPFQFAEIQAAAGFVVNNSTERIRSDARAKLSRKLNILQTDIATEVENMIATGYAPLTPAFKEAIDMLQAEGVELRRLSNYMPRLCFLWSKQNSLAYRYTDSSEPPVEITDMNDLPENLRNKLSMLNIAEQDSPIPDVGVRTDNSCFWVFV